VDCDCKLEIFWLNYSEFVMPALDFSVDLVSTLVLTRISGEFSELCRDTSTTGS
jgi:hypothetical protein